VATKKRRTAQKPVRRKASGTPVKRCGLCGKSGRLTKTACCGKLICDDADKYVLFSYARNSCDRNHRQFTLCGYHHSEEHDGDWKRCSDCRIAFDTEMYVWYGTNEYNFEKLESPPSFEPTLCSSCQLRIDLANDSYTLMPNGDHVCESCYALPMLGERGD